MTSRKQRALEERYRKPSQSFGEYKPTQDQLRLMREMTEKRLAEEHWEKTRPCTLEDVLKHLDNTSNGVWYFRGFERKNWETERDDILTVAYNKASGEYVPRPNNFPWLRCEVWDNLYKEHTVKEWKRRQTKLYKALK